MSNPKERFSEHFETFDEFVRHVTAEAHSALLEKGGAGMRQTLHLWLGQAVNMGKEQASKRS